MNPQNSFDFFDTPKPSERGFVITAKEDTLSDEIPDYLNRLVTWNTCPAWIKRAFDVRNPAMQGYRLIHAQKAGYQLRSFYFAKTRTEAERATPYRVKTLIRPFTWPTVLLQLWFEEGNLPLSAVNDAGDISTAKRVHPRMKYRPGNQYPTRFRISHYLSDEPFPAITKLDQPITDSIQWSFDGSSGSVPECLHPGCTFPHYQTSGAVVPNAGTINTDEIGGLTLEQNYPATPTTDWTTYKIEDSRREVIPGGIMEERIVVEAIAPIDDRDITT